MKTDIDSNYKYPERNAELTCSHCGKIIDNKNAVFKNDKAFCCNGCYGISNLIYSLGLEGYYSLRNIETHKAKGDPETVVESGDFKYLNQQNFKELYTTEESPNSIRLFIEGIHCTGCLWLIENLANTSEEIESVELNMSSNIATVRFNNDLSVFPSLVQSLGYRAYPVQPGSDSANIELNEGKNFLYRIGIAGFCAGNITRVAGLILLFVGLFNLIINFVPTDDRNMHHHVGHTISINEKNSSGGLK